MQYRLTCSLIVLVCAALAIAGCTGSQNVPAGSPTPVPGTGSAGSGSMVPSSPAGSMVTSPTDPIPPEYLVILDVGEKDYLGKIPVIFQGGRGQIHVTRIDVTLTRSDGQVKTDIIGTKKGDEIELEGTKQTDRVEVWVSMNNGQRYKTNDVLSPYRTRQ